MNPTREANLVFADQDLVLKANFAALAGIEKVFGQPIFAAVQTIGSADCTLEQVAKAAAEIFRANKIRLTAEQVGDGIVDYGFGKFIVWLGEFVLLGIRTNDEQPKESDDQGEAPPAT